VIPELATHVLLLLVLVAFLAGAIDAIAGGGGLLTVPALLLAGLPPVAALATNKVQGVFGAASAAVSYARAGQVEPRAQIGPALVAAAAAGLGALLASRLPTDTIRLVLPILLIAIALYFLLKKGLDDGDRAQRLSGPAFAATAVPAVGFYDGLLGPGAGSFYMIGFVTLRGYGLLKATAHTKLLNFASNLGGLVVFAAVAQPWWTLGLAMAAAQVAGATLGARLAVRVGARAIRPLLVTVSLALAARLLWQAWAG